MLFKLNHYLVEAYLNAEGGDWGGGGGGGGPAKQIVKGGGGGGVLLPQINVKACGTREA